ncbi:MAG TPA: glycosyltransferase [Gemmatimonadales bacterium]|nr:glycosyltransferase [Gemmatimonadales bacterium]
MNIGFLAHVYDRREGTGGYAVELVERLSRTHQVTLYATTVRTPPPSDVRVVHVPALRGSAYLTVLTFPAAFRAVRARHDLIHAQGFQTLAADVVTAHIVQQAWRRALARDRVPATIAERLAGGLIAKLENEAFRRSRAVIAPSRRASDDVMRSSGRTSDVFLIPHGCDRPAAGGDRRRTRAMLGLSDGDFLALYIGYPRKGLAPAVEALRLEGNVHLAVLSHSAPGDWPDRAGPAAGRLHWLAPDTSVADALAAADCLVHPTCYDTFGLPIAEALSAGVPVIASRDAGASELLRHERSGWLLDSRSGEAVAAAIAALRDQPALRSRLSAEGRRVASEWTWDIAAQRTIEVYERIAG